MPIYFAAPWSRALKMTSAAVVLLSVVVSVSVGLPGALPLLAILGGCAVFAVRGYTVGDGQLIIHCLGWSTTYALAELMEVAVLPGAMQGSMRVFGTADWVGR